MKVIIALTYLVKQQLKTLRHGDFSDFCHGICVHVFRAGSMMSNDFLPSASPFYSTPSSHIG